ncbi:unnamed protein product [Chrysodeixis includens]|uniref:Uncharacterized protein n=1 Tax=Chrysodeixis includens TaxID=689277 RepID=A0A9N8L3U1_CHRIL|nr:unnamed protein product [Chrysodeixis includens]
MGKAVSSKKIAATDLFRLSFSRSDVEEEKSASARGAGRRGGGARACSDDADCDVPRRPAPPPPPSDTHERDDPHTSGPAAHTTIH